ncbi:hypothetical protein O0I10_006239 [Lichtheimia ornata]|uniref:Uncharacterized protein n=1 Tax=Lichtheimia ornata TaxID=688661 RepID=A0AAD7XYU9_9FUNG|nr:uncharacterized protein O0I10_006239 [Lichtheimia ornata]KAJ8657968.1 hypothetical protein O0I10_006239 [Lichtheimia ornata]
MQQGSHQRRGASLVSSSVALVPSSSLPSVPQEPAVPSSAANVSCAIVPVVCAHVPARAIVPCANVPSMPSVPQQPVVPASANVPHSANVPRVIVPAPLPVVAIPVPVATTTDADVAHLYDAFKARSLVDAFGILLVPLFETLTVADAYDEDVYMRPPVDVHYQEPLWLAGIILSDFMDDTDDMDASFSPLPSPLLTPLPFAPGVPVVASPEPVPMYLDSASLGIPLLPAPMHTTPIARLTPSPILVATPFVHPFRTTTTPMPSPENFMQQPMPPPSLKRPQPFTIASASLSPSSSPSSPP